MESKAENKLFERQVKLRYNWFYENKLGGTLQPDQTRINMDTDS